MEDEVAEMMDAEERRHEELRHQLKQHRLLQRCLIWVIAQICRDGHGVEAGFCSELYSGIRDTMSGFLEFLWLPKSDKMEEWGQWLSEELNSAWVELKEQDGKIFICPTRRGRSAVERLRHNAPRSYVGDWRSLLSHCQYGATPTDDYSSLRRVIYC